MSKRRKPGSTIELTIHPDLVRAMEEEAAAMRRYKAVMASVPDTPDAVEAAFIANFDTIIFGDKK